MVTVLTLCSANYLAHAKALGDSLREHNPDFHFVLGLVDRLPKKLPPGYLDAFDVIPVEEVPMPEFKMMLKKYNIVELNTAVKPFYMEFLYQRDSQVEAVIYLDPDILVYGSFGPLLKRLEQNNIVVTPHSCTYDNSLENFHYEKVMLYAGIYNLGFLGTKRSPVTDAFLKWWKRRLYDHCYFRPGVAGSFFDQLWLGLAPIYFDAVYVETDLGYNVCYWNHFERRLSLNNGKYVVNDRHDLVFVHFSSYKPENPHVSANRPTEPILSFATRPDLRSLYDDYRNRLLERNYLMVKETPWCFAPPSEAQGKTMVKNVFKRCITGPLQILPVNIRKRIKRFAQFICQNC
jgi:hypothetical protein